MSASLVASVKLRRKEVQSKEINLNFNFSSFLEANDP